MANGANIPATVQGSFDYPAPYMAIGSQYYAPSDINSTNAYWYLVLDRATLKEVANEVSTSNGQVPASVQQYAANPQYLLVFATSALRTDNVPQGPVYDFLRSAGSGPLLDRAEQINEQLGTGTIGNISYILVATMDTGDASGFEEFSFNHLTVMTFALMPITVDGQTFYTPIRHI